MLFARAAVDIAEVNFERSLVVFVIIFDFFADDFGDDLGDDFVAGFFFFVVRLFEGDAEADDGVQCREVVEKDDVVKVDKDRGLLWGRFKQSMVIIVP